MTSPGYVRCPSGCGEFRDTSGRYTSPANRERDARLWQEEHLSGKCKTTPATTDSAAPDTKLNSSFSRDEVSAAINRASDDIARLSDDEALRDAMNLVVNATMHFLDHPESTLAKTIEHNYDEDPETVFAWIGEAA